jgi:glycosyltransferase involved in cell wall biosynthesis
LILELKPLANPIMLVSDSPGQQTGLARLCRDLATLLSELPQFRVAVLGRTPFAGINSRKYPWMSYPFPEAGQWGEEYVMRAWQDFAGEDAGIIMSLWDLSRMFWFAQPHRLREDLATFLGPGRKFMKWAYVPVDSTGPDEQGLPIGMSEAAKGFERMLAASEWGANVIRRHRICDWIPHGIDMNTFAIHDKMWDPAGKYEGLSLQRKMLGWDDSTIWLGCNMSNQARKDWPVAFECARILKADLGNKFKFWAHTDVMLGYWNLYALATDYGVGDSVEVTLDLTDEQLAQRYSACDVTILPSASEGFGYPIAESMACGTACVVTDYAAGQEIVDPDCRVPPVAYRVDTAHNVRRAVLSGWGFAGRAKAQIERKRNDWEFRGQELRERVEHLDWSKLRHVWRRWFLEGIGL